MIANDRELQMTLERISRFQRQVSALRVSETDPGNYRASASGFLAEIDRMQLEVREYHSVHPAKLASYECITKASNGLADSPFMLVVER